MTGDRSYFAYRIDSLDGIALYVGKSTRLHDKSFARVGPVINRTAPLAVLAKIVAPDAAAKRFAASAAPHIAPLGNSLPRIGDGLGADKKFASRFPAGSAAP